MPVSGCNTPILMVSELAAAPLAAAPALADAAGLGDAPAQAAALAGLAAALAPALLGAAAGALDAGAAPPPHAASRTMRPGMNAPNVFLTCLTYLLAMFDCHGKRPLVLSC